MMFGSKVNTMGNYLYSYLYSMFTMAKEDKFLKWLGIVFMAIGSIAVLSAFPGILSVVAVGPIEISGIAQSDATCIATI